MNAIDIDALEALATDLTREQDAMQKSYDDRARELALPIVTALRLGDGPVELLDAWCDGGDAWIRIGWVREGNILMGRTLTAEGLAELLLQQAAEEAFA
jgi:hypothetical protein